MSIRRENISTISLITMLVIFVGTVIAVQLTTVYMSVGWLFILYMIYLLRPVSRGVRDVSLLSMLYLLGYWLCVYLSVFIKEYLNLVDFPGEFIIACSRLSLIGFIIPFLVLRIITKSTTDYLKKGSFTETIYFPLIWKGVKDPIWRFLLIASCVVIFSFSFVIDYSPENLYSLLWFGLLFALINSVLEEILWRGLILSRFVDVLGEKLGLVIVSIGFGMYHYSIGFPWSICALFSIFGMVLGGITIRSKGLLPVMILHFIMNMLFVFSGLIFNM
ncbi:CPBP family intramembrane glutamic endopeptidase [Paenibacillus macquariensis]|uniref:CAAX prenyl protease 2/Lysostaphin resistance protein A-like domain-containing protein n=1 Tax=Paenibacillus macquariensis TaxID=948756 RepID=A0ABY1K0H1_9BACL|nr:CPBP family intramembrane glutamic endopeptidase [Paenibacillus macquariensis]MEC0091496.1 CPBP family intramembrane metalloprotease [Paenibacillus macquariensis]OAB38165.1 hypothetical protein PMSM_03260 [Paenibacillus macquariensis subsp. macquariensis]SIR07959.1 hypothetical protein SAMN05421578_106309 [Paenibacillus macquariensis]